MIIFPSLEKEREDGTPAPVGKKDGKTIEMERLINNAELDWGCGVVEWKEGEEFANIHINVKASVSILRIFSSWKFL